MASALLGLVLLTGSAGPLIYERPSAPRVAPYLPLENQANGYVSSKQCGACHPDTHASWKSSYHRTMTQVASPETLLGPLGERPLRHKGRRIALRESDGKVIATVREKSGATSEREFALV